MNACEHRDIKSAQEREARLQMHVKVNTWLWRPHRKKKTGYSNTWLPRPHKRERTGYKTPQEREARLQQMRDLVAAETPHARLQQISGCVFITALQTALSLIRRFHDHFPSLDSTRCATCSESFQLHTECVCCFRDKQKCTIVQSASHVDRGAKTDKLHLPSLTSM